MIDTKLVLSILSKDSTHIPSSYYKTKKQPTVFEVAKELEERYHVVSKFIDKYKDDITYKIAKEKMYCYINNDNNTSKSNLVIANYIKNLWLDYMVKGEHGITSIRASKTGTVGLIDTGDYYLSMRFNVAGAEV